MLTTVSKNSKNPVRIKLWRACSLYHFI